MAGRRLPNSPSCERIFSRPRSGRMAGSMVSHFGPPTAPSSTASAARARSRVSSASGTPYLSMAAPPNSSKASSKPRANLSLARFSTLTASAMISGPIPSPGRTRICLLITSSRNSGCAMRTTQKLFRCAPRTRLNALLDRAEQPGAGLLVTDLEGLDRLLILQGQADVIQAVEQAVLAEGIDLEAVLHAIRTGHGLRLEIDGQLIPLGGLGLLEQRIDLCILE